jgi:sterol desaturase/sphingolipid hydroxylase (fatty acid hydroxylase superfamily)
LAGVSQDVTPMPTATSLPLKPTKPRSWLISITLAPWNYALSFAVDTAVALTLLAWAAFTVEGTAAVVPVVVCAVLSWTLLEYVSHRFVFHGARSPRPFREGHGRHHGMPDAHLAMPFFTSPFVALVITTAAGAIIGPGLGALYTGVCGVGYVAYGALHHLVHDPNVRVPPVPWLRAVHEVHHARPNRNFGVTSPLWDLILGTWSAPARR